MKPAIEEKAKEHEKKGIQKSGDLPIRTDKEVAKLAGVSHDTVRKVEVIEREATEEIKQAARKGEMSVNKAYRATKKKEEKLTQITKKEDTEALSSLKRWWKKAKEKEHERKTTSTKSTKSSDQPVDTRAEIAAIVGEEAIQYCRSYAMEAERKMGEMLAQTERAHAGRPVDNQLPDVTNYRGAPTLTDLGLTKRESGLKKTLDIPGEVCA